MSPKCSLPHQPQARDMLNTQLEELAGIRGWRVKVVYDGGENKGKVSEEAHTGGAKIKAEGSTDVVEVVYSPLGIEADTLIERLSFEVSELPTPLTPPTPHSTNATLKKSERPRQRRRP